MKRTKVTGFKELIAAFGELKRTSQERIVAQSLRPAAARVRTVVRRRAPRGKDPSPASEKYGSLRSNIRMFRLRRVQKPRVVYRVDVGRAFWGTFLEYGTSRMPPYPFFRQAVDEAITPAMETFKTRFARALQREVDRLGRKYRR